MPLYRPLSATPERNMPTGSELLRTRAPEG